MKMGKHVFCQKPLTHDIYESRMLTKAAKETGVVTQMGIQGHSQEGLLLICEWIWDGAIGTVHQVDAWCSLSYAPHGHTWWSSPLSDRPNESPTRRSPRTPSRDRPRRKRHRHAGAGPRKTCSWKGIERSRHRISASVSPMLSFNLRESQGVSVPTGARTDLTSPLCRTRIAGSRPSRWRPGQT